MRSYSSQNPHLSYDLHAFLKLEELIKKKNGIREVHEGVTQRNISSNISNVWGKYSAVKGADIAILFHVDIITYLEKNDSNR